MGALIDDCPEVAEIDAAIAANQSDEAQYVANVTALREDWKTRLDLWVQRDQAEALRTGRPPKNPKPTLPVDQQDHLWRLRDFANQRQHLQGQRRDKVAELAPRIEQQGQERLEAIAKEGHALADRASVLAEQANCLLADVHAARRAQYEVNVATGPGGVDPGQPTPLTGPSLIAALAAGRPLAAPPPPQTLGFIGNPWSDAPARELRLNSDQPPDYPPEPVPLPPVPA